MDSENGEKNQNKNKPNSCEGDRLLVKWKTIIFENEVCEQLNDQPSTTKK